MAGGVKGAGGGDRLFDRAIGKEIVPGKANYDDSTDPGERPFTASPTIRWTLTFTFTKSR